MNESDVRTLWEQEKRLYEAWGNFVREKINEVLTQAVAPVDLAYFLKIPATPRIKTVGSLIDKALHRGKKYKDPYRDITDKVGIRYVVLLVSQIETVCEAIRREDYQSFWTFSKDKDFEAEREARPLEFVYQSVHYVLTSKPGLTFEGITLPAGLACEVQIRTLLQHAHSELTHDTLYKPKAAARPAVHRTVAKSMALIEATDEFFEEAMQKLRAEGKAQNQVLEILSAIYKRGVGGEPGREPSNALITDALTEILPTDLQQKIDAFYAEKGYIFDRIRKHRETSHLFSQPAILLAYFLAECTPARLKAAWPLESTELETAFSDLGRSYDE
ncbi:RelA/SpoT domain-containing protein [Castellaniella sp. GW247-6E4]|uniref:GTP pyrophosphokinase n=1 Tax=Castellaniella sp. GW247-6E4 TaxID=3140380 RepID=UPI003316422D